jgi:hypothetical protein
MGYALKICCVLLSLSLSACGGEVLGIGSLVMQGLQMASGGGSSSTNGSKNTAPFTRMDNAQDQQALSDVTSKTVSQACTAANEAATNATAANATAVNATAVNETKGSAEQVRQSPLPQTAQASTQRQCGYRNICLPGNARPVRMLICENPTPVAQTPITQEPNLSKDNAS